MQKRFRLGFSKRSQDVSPCNCCTLLCSRTMEKTPITSPPAQWSTSGACVKLWWRPTSSTLWKSLGQYGTLLPPAFVCECDSDRKWSFSIDRGCICRLTSVSAILAPPRKPRQAAHLLVNQTSVIALCVYWSST